MRREPSRVGTGKLLAQDMIQKIKAIVDQLTGAPSWSYSDIYEQNSEADSIDFSHGNVHLVEIEKGSFNIHPTTGSFRDRKQLYLRFTKITDFDHLSSDRDPVIKEMEALAKEFVLKFNNSGEFDLLVGDIPYIYIHNSLDVNVSGIELQIQARELYPESTCL